MSRLTQPAKTAPSHPGVQAVVAYQHIRQLSDAEMGRRLGMNRHDWGLIRRGLRHPGWLILMRLYQALPHCFGHVPPVEVPVGPDVDPAIVWLATYQRDHALTDRAIAKLLGVARGTWGLARRGQTVLSPETRLWQRLAAVFPHALPRRERERHAAS